MSFWLLPDSKKATCWATRVTEVVSVALNKDTQVLQRSTSCFLIVNIGHHCHDVCLKLSNQMMWCQTFDFLFGTTTLDRNRKTCGRLMQFYCSLSEDGGDLHRKLHWPSSSLDFYQNMCQTVKRKWKFWTGSWIKVKIGGPLQTPLSSPETVRRLSPARGVMWLNGW